MADHNISEPASEGQDLRATPLAALHRELGARMVPFAGWTMPVTYDGEHGGVIAEHTWCRTMAGLFDVSHMAVIELRGDNPAAGLETVTPAGITSLAEGRQRYGLLLNDDGGVVDDYMVTNWGSHLVMVANASRRDVDLEYLTSRLSPVGVEVVERPDVALLAIQGPRAAEVLTGLADEPATVGAMVFLDNRPLTVAGIPVMAARSGYTGEDGFELAVDHDDAERLARLLLNHEAVQPVGLGARDTLRLEAGLCLYGNDLDETTSPVEADLLWSVPKRRREAADYPGAKRVERELADGPDRIRVGIKPNGRRPVRDGAPLSLGGGAAGSVTSGGFGPTVDGPVAMGYVRPEHAPVGTELTADVRGKDVDCTVSELPFVPQRYHRG